MKCLCFNPWIKLSRGLILLFMNNRFKDNHFGGYYLYQYACWARVTCTVTLIEFGTAFDI